MKKIKINFLFYIIKTFKLLLIHKSLILKFIIFEIKSIFQKKLDIFVFNIENSWNFKIN